MGLAPCLLGTWCTTEGASERGCPPRQLEGAEGLGTFPGDGRDYEDPRQRGKRLPWAAGISQSKEAPSGRF